MVLNFGLKVRQGGLGEKKKRGKRKEMDLCVGMGEGKGRPVLGFE